MRLTSGTLTTRDPLDGLTPPPPLPATFGASPLESNDWQPTAMPHALQFSPETRARPYRLRDGDTLENLAERFLGDAGRAEEIFQANRQVLAHPDLLPIGKTIMIPPRMRVEDLEPAAR
jgi:nucleoid-associated protein YgaU